MDQKYFICKQCGNIVDMVRDKGVPIMCCGKEMAELVPNTTDAAGEKHVPVYQVRDNTVHVAVGATGHPMLEEHSIEWVSIQTKAGMQRKPLKPGEPPEACSPRPRDGVPARFSDGFALWYSDEKMWNDHPVSGGRSTSCLYSSQPVRWKLI